MNGDADRARQEREERYMMLSAPLLGILRGYWR
jgi:hypothetical protein